MKQALVLVWLLAVSEPMIRFKTCMIVMAPVWSLGGKNELLGDEEARRMFVALRHGKLRESDRKQTRLTIEMQPVEGLCYGTCTTIEQLKGRLDCSGGSVRLRTQETSKLTFLSRWAFRQAEGKRLIILGKGGECG